jgi:N-acetylmuramoyl-L-alanine amidase
VRKAKDAKADLFISLHADSHPDPSMSGMSIYTISDRASDEEAALLASQENKTDIIKGLNLTDESTEVTSALIDLARRSSKNSSVDFANILIHELEKDVKVLKNAHRFAGFRVLKGTDIPGILIELGYLSNPREEKLLCSKDYKDKILFSLSAALDTHFKNRISATSLVSK